MLLAYFLHLCSIHLECIDALDKQSFRWRGLLELSNSLTLLDSSLKLSKNYYSKPLARLCK
jgi:hypothetical protein